MTVDHIKLNFKSALAKNNRSIVNVFCLSDNLKNSYSKCLIHMQTGEDRNTSSIYKLYAVIHKQSDKKSVEDNRESQVYLSMHDYEHLQVDNECFKLLLIDRIGSGNQDLCFDVTDYVNSMCTSDMHVLMEWVIMAEDDNYLPSFENIYLSLCSISKENISVNTKKHILTHHGLTYEKGNFALFPNITGGGLITCNGYQYTAFYNERRYICVSRKPLDDHIWETMELDDYYFSSNDTHNTVEIGISEGDGTIHLAFDHHANDLHYRYSCKGVTQNPLDYKWEPSLFSDVTSTINGTKLMSLTYPKFINTPDKGLLFMYRLGTSGNGSTHLAKYNTENSKWNILGKLFDSTGNYVGKWSGSNSDRGHYLIGFEFDKKSILHCSFMWRETPDSMTNHDISYIKSYDMGSTWYNCVDEKVGETNINPITIETNNILVKECGEQRGLINMKGFTSVDKLERIHIALQHIPWEAPDVISQKQGFEVRRNFHYMLNKNGSMTYQNIFFGGSKSPIFLDDEDNAYLVYIAKDYHFEVIEQLEFEHNKLRIAMATNKSDYKDWHDIYVEKNLNPLALGLRMDLSRFKNEKVLSVMVQERITKKLGEATSLYVMEYKLDHEKVSNCESRCSFK